MEVVKFLKKSLFLLPVVLVIAGFGYFIDPACVFKDDQFYKNIASMMLKGDNIANLVNYDDRLLTKYYISGLQKKKDILVFGSSRALLIDSEMFPGYSLFNNGLIRGVSIEDHMALYWMYREKGLIPKFVIIGLDPWILDGNNGSTRYVSLVNEYDGIMTYLYGKSDRTNVSRVNLKNQIKKYMELMSPSYFQTSFWIWLSLPLENKLNGVQYYPTPNSLANYRIKRSDGSLGYDGLYRNTSAAEARILAQNNNGYYFPKIDGACADKFEKLIDLMQKDKIKVLFFLPPYNPLTYKFQEMNSTKTLEKAEKFFKDLAARKKIKVIGSFDPAYNGLNESDFYDGLHAKYPVIKKYFSRGIHAFQP